MAQSFRFLQIHAVPIPQLTKGELQEALQNVTAQVGGAFKPSGREETGHPSIAHRQLVGNAWPEPNSEQLGRL